MSKHGECNPHSCPWSFGVCEAPQASSLSPLGAQAGMHDIDEQCHPITGPMSAPYGPAGCAASTNCCWGLVYHYTSHVPTTCAHLRQGDQL
jgi:hypothetical protein